MLATARAHKHRHAHPHATPQDALWYATRDVPDGSVHVLLATANAKTALKYGLLELPAGEATHTVALGGECGSIDVPVRVRVCLSVCPPLLICVS
jgi:hypothetical protein